jgi:hypothetical protein
MGYSDQKFYSRGLFRVSNAVSFGTSTGAGTASNSVTSGINFPKFTRRTQVNKIRVICTTIPNVSSTALNLVFLNGTNTFGAIAVTTATTSQVLDATMTAANAIFAADSQPTASAQGTATVSGAANGSYDIYFEEQELYA